MKTKEQKRKEATARAQVYVTQVSDELAMAQNRAKGMSRCVQKTAELGLIERLTARLEHAKRNLAQTAGKPYKADDSGLEMK